MDKKLETRLVKTVRCLVRSLLFVSTLAASTTFAWVATRLDSFSTGLPSTGPEVWTIQCKDGTAFLWYDYTNGNTGPEWTYSGCAGHGGLVVAPASGFPPIQEFQVDIFSGIVSDIGFPPATVERLVLGEILSAPDAIQLTSPADPSTWDDTLVTFSPLADPSNFAGVSVLGQSVDITQSSVPEPSSVVLTVLALTAVWRVRRRWPLQNVWRFG